MTAQLEMQQKPAAALPTRTFQPMTIMAQEKEDTQQTAPDVKSQVSRAESFGHSLGSLSASPISAPAQAKAASSLPIQREAEEGEEMQAKSAGSPIQREAEEEEEMQMKLTSSPIQREAEEEETQMKAADPVQKSDQPVQFFLPMLLPALLPMLMPMITQMLPQLLGGMMGGGGAGGNGGGGSLM